MSAENVISNSTTKCRAQAFALWPLHQNDEHHQSGDQDKKHQAKVNQQVHREAKYELEMTNVERLRGVKSVKR